MLQVHSLIVILIGQTHTVIVLILILILMLIPKLP